MKIIYLKTRDWLSGEDLRNEGLDEKSIEEIKENRIFHLVLDELHLYRGTSGTEISYLIRIVLRRIGLSSQQQSIENRWVECLIRFGQ